ncbi:OLC1v1032058C3 [Oldenlandia corymbosa var. corymbosa]|uniref:OLC1v1032058C3 n=1 Tax=Oldenlandia corymbosa var. corymbosa TaxID=529605 RepID=A0AAV1CMT8_OLDCO|nr:OLC1v1032058C3 [Oldenlandia corymbosa var. corymbosa]
MAAPPSSSGIKLSHSCSKFIPNRGVFFKPTFRNASCFTCSCSSTPADSERKTSSSVSTITKPNRKVYVGAQFTELSSIDDSEISNVGGGAKSWGNRKFTFDVGLEKRAFWRRIWFESKKVRSIILLNCITVIYASNIPVVKQVEAYIKPEAFTIVRFSLAALLFSPFVFKARGDNRTRNAGIELGFWVSLGYLMQALGLQTSGAGRASFLTMFTVIVVPLLDGLLGSEIPAVTWFGAFMSIVGVGMLETSGAAPCVGDFLNFSSAVFFGVHMLRTQHISRSTHKDNFLALLGYQVSVVAFLSTLLYIFGASFGGDQTLNPSSWTWAKISDWMLAFPWVPAVYTGIVSTGLCLWAELAAMRDVSATETAIIYGLEPLWGAGFAWLLLGERWGVSGWIGAALVLGK